MSEPRNLPGAERFLVKALERQEAMRARTYSQRIIDKANTEISIFAVLSDFFDLNPPREGNFKSHCPFSFEHPDGGMERGFRTYPATNSSMCFIMHGYLPPVRMYGEHKRLASFPAARRLLHHYGLGKPEYWKTRMPRLLAEAAETETEIGNPQNAVEALNLSLSTHPQFTRRQFDSDYMDSMNLCLSVLDKCVEAGDPENVREWLPKAKKKMIRTIERTAS